MEELLDDMRSLFHGLELNQELPLDDVANISLNMEEIHLLAEWEIRNVVQMTTPTKSDCRMGNFEDVKNWFLASCYSLVVRMGFS